MRRNILLVGHSLLAASFLCAALSVWSVPWTNTSKQERAWRWVAAKRGALPTSRPAIALYPPEYQEAIYMALPAEAKRNIWREYLMDVVQNDEFLTDIQRAMLSTLSTTISAT